MSFNIDPNNFNPLARGVGQSEKTSDKPLEVGVFGEHKVNLGSTGNWTLRKMYDSVVGLVAKPWRNLKSFFGWGASSSDKEIRSSITTSSNRNSVSDIQRKKDADKDADEQAAATKIQALGRSYIQRKKAALGMTEEEFDAASSQVILHPEHASLKSLDSGVAPESALSDRLGATKELNTAREKEFVERFTELYEKVQLAKEEKPANREQEVSKARAERQAYIDANHTIAQQFPDIFTTNQYDALDQFAKAKEQLEANPKPPDTYLTTAANFTGLSTANKDHETALINYNKALAELNAVDLEYNSETDKISKKN